MLTIGLIGGTGWPATRDYYELLNRLAQERLGGLHGAELRVWSFDFQKLLDVADQSGAIDAYFCQAALALKNSGAQLLALASNTGHLYLSTIDEAGLPLIHIGQACADLLAASKVKRVGILATRRACAGGVFDAHFVSAGVTPSYLDPALAALLDQAIFNELELGKPGPMTHQVLALAAKSFSQQGIDDILLGCTELRPALLPPEILQRSSATQPPLRFWDSTEIHCKAIIDKALLASTVDCCE